MNASRFPTATSLAIGLAAGALGAGLMLLMSQFDRRYAPKTIPHFPKQARTHLDPVTRQPVPALPPTSAQPSVLAPLFCGAVAAGVYGLLRGRHKQHSALAHGLLLGSCTYTAGAFAIMPVLGITPFPWKQSFPEIGGELLRHAVFGIAATATYGLIDNVC